ncbi:MAG: sugar ABC transporter permease [Anaerolineales bacterium]|nr:sugar ABC transporter permease [Anaerolineales bacterium]
MSKTITPPGQRRDPARLGLNRLYRLELYALLSPYLAGTFIMVAIPALLSLLLAFASYDALAPPVWNGWQNFRQVGSNALFWIALRNSLYFIVLAVPLRLLGALALALFLNKPRPGVGFYRAAIYLPTIVPDMAYALIWLWIFNPLYGPLNQTLALFGLPTPAWLVDPATAKLAFVIMAIFQLGEGFVVLLAGLKDIPGEYYESARMDGGNRWQLFRYITLPILGPWLILLTFRDIILSFQSTFTPSYAMTGGDPYYATLFLPLLIFQEAFDRFRFGTGSAMMLLMFLTTLLLLWLLFRFFGWGHDQ